MSWVFEASEADGTLRDRFTYDGPFELGLALAEERAAARAPGLVIGHHAD